MGDRDFVQQPPLIPHNTQGYQITELQQVHGLPCLGRRPRPAAPRSASPLPHRTGTELDNISPRRYFARNATCRRPTPRSWWTLHLHRARGLRESVTMSI
ncbi:MAG: nitrate reductase cytochrome c-type subunit [Ideonella sp.]|nr:nitrate reductase cytochrome c-type subunit [Ideonella sp.]